MLASIIQQLQAVPVHVIVDKTRAGMSEWSKTLISASVGAVVGVTTSILMEYVKSAIAKRDLKRLTTHELDDELLDNLNYVDSAMRILAHAKDKDKHAQTQACIFVLPIIMDLMQDRYDHYMKEEISTVYEIYDKKYLSTFYGFSTDKAISIAREYKFHELAPLLVSMGRIGHLYIEERKLQYREGTTIMEDVYMDNPTPLLDKG